MYLQLINKRPDAQLLGSFVLRQHTTKETSNISPMKPAGYSRISQDRDTSTSVAAQNEMLHKWADLHGYSAMPIYSDEGASAFKEGTDRPGFKALLNAINERHVDTIVVKSADRLSRRLRVFADITDRANVVTIEGGIDTSTPAGRMMVSLLATFAQYESENAGARQKVSQDYRRQTGRALGRPPYGYSNHEEADGTYRQIDPHTGPIARQIIERIIEGDAIRSVAEWLNSHGHVTVQGNKWSASSVSQWLDLPQLAGMRAHGGDVLRDADGLPIIDQHLAVVSLPEWRALREAKSSRRKYSSKGATHERLLLAGLVHCGSCGRTMSRGQTKAHGKTYANYACTADNRGLCLDRPSISAPLLEEHIEGLLEPLMSWPVMETVHDADPVATERRELLKTQMDEIAAELRSAEANKIPDLARQLARTRRDLDSIAVETVPRNQATGQTLHDLWKSDRRMVINHAIARIVVNRANSTHTPVRDRVIVIMIGDDLSE